MTGVDVGMLVRRPAAQVFRAFADPAVTTRFWYTRSSGPMTAGATLRWDWEMYDLSTTVKVLEVEQDSRIVFEWNEDRPATVELRFLPWKDDTTYVRVLETGHSGDDVAQLVADSSSGFSFVLSALKALLEHDVVLRVVLDHRPAGLEL